MFSFPITKALAFRTGVLFKPSLAGIPVRALSFFNNKPLNDNNINQASSDDLSKKNKQSIETGGYMPVDQIVDEWVSRDNERKSKKSDLNMNLGDRKEHILIKDGKTGLFKEKFNDEGRSFDYKKRE